MGTLVLIFNKPIEIERARQKLPRGAQYSAPGFDYNRGKSINPPIF
jgi:hypothetical protein